MTKKKQGRSGKPGKPQTRRPKASPKKDTDMDAVAELAPPPAIEPKPVKVNITAAKGRPMLTWVGKRPLSHVTAFPAQRVERHDALRIVGIDPQNIDTDDEKMEFFRDLRSQCNEECWKDAPFINGVWTPEVGGVLLHGDNKDVLAFLLANGYRESVSLIYIDPPFDSGADYIRKVALRGPSGAAKLEGESYAIGEQLQYADIWVNDNYLQFMFERLLLLRELLTENGTVYVQCDPRRSHHLRCLLDEVFGANGFIGEIVWRRSTAHSDARNFGAIHDVILCYGLGDEPVFNRQFTPHDASYIASHYTNVDEEGRRYRLDNITSPHPRPNLTYVWKGYEPPHFGWRYSKEKMEELDRQGRIHYPKNGGRPSLKRYLDELEGVPLQDVWDDINPVNSQALEAVGFPTQKPEELLERIISVSTNPGDLVLDCFLGSGTTAAVAQKLGRRWIGCDINKGAIQTTVKRLRGIMAEQIGDARRRGAAMRQGKLIETNSNSEPTPKPCAFGFTVWRVNDYDLQIQHNEAVNLACEHIGIERTRTDSYFEGTLGKKLVKIIPFGHPLTLLDLEELKRELESRPDEDRGIVVVCLGMELAAKALVDDWNRLRKGAGAVNRIEVIELRTDPKYGKFIKHEPATAKVKIVRKKRGDDERIVVEIQDFISPTIIQRLRDQAGILSPKIDDWRAMVDCIYIDTAYNGTVLNVALADVPERKADLVSGKYELPAQADETTVAVKIVDMLGEEALVTQLV